MQRTLITLLALLLTWTGSTLAGEKPFHRDRPLAPQPYDSAIAKATANILTRYHYSRKPMDDELSGRFLDMYLKTLDGQRLFFLESDVRIFDAYRTTLDDLTVKSGDVSPAFLIFNRFIERLQSNYSFATNEIHQGNFTFNGDDNFVLNREDEPRPANMQEAKILWKQRLRHEYLQEKLNFPPTENLVKEAREKLGQTKDLESFLKKNFGETKAADHLKNLTSESSEEERLKGFASTIEKDRKAAIQEILLKRYNRIRRSFMELDGDDVLSINLSSLARIYDPHSDYMGPSELENFEIGMKLSLFGIGAQLISEDGYCTIYRLLPGPAMKSRQLSPKDRIVAVAQGNGEPVDVVDEKLTSVVELIRGPKGSEVRLTVIPHDAPDPSVRKIVKLVRDEIKLADQEAKSQIIDLPLEGGGTRRLGVIDLPSFYTDFNLSHQTPEEERKSTTTDVARLLKKLKEEKIEGLVLDLRRNGGGSLEESVSLTGLFIDKGPVVQIKDTFGRVHTDADEAAGVLYDGPMIVLTSRFSASASEILAGALQDYGRAMIVGDESTHGKGTVQTLLELKDFFQNDGGELPFKPGALKVTIRKFYRPSGASTQLKGVVPDLILPSVNNHAEVGEATQDYALPWDTIDKTRFAHLNQVEGYLDSLKKLSTARQSTSRDFEMVREDIERADKLRKTKAVSLNEEKRRQEMLEAKELVEARKKEILSRPEDSRDRYFITLKQAAEKGLPAPGFPEDPEDEMQAFDEDDDKPVSAEDLAWRKRSRERDVYLDEALHILSDWIRLQREGKLTALSGS